jgi:hypothetical protein
VGCLAAIVRNAYSDDLMQCRFVENGWIVYWADMRLLFVQPAPTEAIAWIVGLGQRKC